MKRRKNGIKTPFKNQRRSSEALPLRLFPMIAQKWGDVPLLSRRFVIYAL
ncbi:hypothetical protein GCWU000341_00047 [Oribacterium sp. oral taxon 078 str. F0262]|nr:hypothetical protein GCWU000341_00047 [Oribacterium sp. oral taxon 078 str. F0262]